MRNIFLGLVFLLPLISYADLKIKEKTDITLHCYNTDELFATLKKEYDETPFFMGQADDVASSTMSFWVSRKGESWTIVASVDDLSCVVGTGKNIQVIRQGKII